MLGNFFQYLKDEALIMHSVITCCCSVAQLCLPLCDPMDSTQPSLSFTISPSLLKLMPIELVMPSNYLILCHPLLLLPSIFSSLRVFSELALCIKWPKYWSFSFSMHPCNEYSRLISFRIDWVMGVRGKHPAPSPLQ